MMPPAFIDTVDPTTGVTASIRSERISAVLSMPGGGCRILTRDGTNFKSDKTTAEILALINPTPQPDATETPAK